MVTPYITFCGDCADALGFYTGVFGGDVRNKRLYGEYIPTGLAEPPANLGEWVLHAELDICGTTFWFADEAAAPPTVGTNIKLVTQTATAAEAAAIFDGLSAGAAITLPPTATFYSAFHAGLIDRFGVCWNIVTTEPPRP